MKTAVYILLSLFIVALIFTPYAVSWELIFGVNQAKAFWFYGAALLIICLAFFYLALKKKGAIPFHWPDLCILLYYAYIVSHIFFTDPDKYYSDKFAVQTLWVALYYIIKTFWYTANRQTERYMEIFSLGILLSAGGEAVIGLLQLYGFEPSLNYQFQITGTFVNPAPYSFILGAVFPFALAVYFKYKEELKNGNSHKSVQLPYIGKVRITVEHVLYYTSIPALLLILLILPVTLIRTGWLMAIAGSVVVVYAYYKEYVHQFWAKKWVKIIGLPAVLVVAVGVSTGAYILKKDSADGRALIWEITLDKIKEAPIFGQGYGAFYSQYNNWQADLFAAHPVEKEGPKAMLAGNGKFAYNEYLEILSELGLIGLALCMGFIGVVAYQFLKRWNIKNNNAIAVLPVLVAILAGSFLSYPLYTLPTHILLFIFLAIAVSQQKEIKSFKISWIPKLVVLLCICIASFFFVKKEYLKYEAYKDWKFAGYFMNTQSFGVATAELEEIYPVLKHDGSFLQHYGKALSLHDQPEESNKILKEATAFSNDIYLYTTMGDNYKAINDFENAEKAYQQAINMVPHKFFAPYLLAKLHHESGNKEQAEMIANKLLQKEVKVHSTAIEEIKQEMKNILTAKYPEQKTPQRERSSAKRKGTGSKEEV